MIVDSSAPNSARVKFIVLTGTTASGKTAVSLPLAESLQGEIISADSRQIFRELVIGTAKPDANALRRVPHHFIDERSIHEPWTAGDFARAARQRISEIIARGRTPIVVGGSMLYLRALLDGFYDAHENATDYPVLRTELAARGAEALYEELKSCDPGLAARTNPADHHRLLRGLSVYRSTGKPLSEFQTERTSPISEPYSLFFLHGDRAETYARVNTRVIEMMELGLVEEVRALWNQNLTDENCNALATHGYREVFPYLRGEIDFDTMIAAIQQAVRHYVKRQMTWFRRDPGVIWIERSFNEPDAKIAERICQHFESSL